MSELLKNSDYWRFASKTYCINKYDILPFKSHISSNIVGYDITSSSVSIVSMVNPALVNRLPISLTSVNGDICGDKPPRRSNSANCSEDRSSYKVSPPNTAANNTPSCFKHSKILLNAFGKSLTQCKLKLDMTRSSEFGSNYKHLAKVSKNQQISLQDLAF